MSETLANGFEVPIIPNRPLKSVGEAESFGRMSLRKNRNSQLIENGAFDATMIEYDEDYQNNQAVSAAFAAHMKSVLDRLKRSYPKGSTVVEVGCGKGDFVELVQDDGWFGIAGYDGAYEGDNPAIEQRYLEASDSIDADIVVLRHVLEHIQRPHEFLHLLSDVFGSTDIYIEVPEFEWIRRNQAFFDITYEHVNYFTPASLSGLFATVDQHGTLFGDQYQFVIANLGTLRYDAHRASYDDAGAWRALPFDALFPSFQSMLDALQRDSEDKEIYIWGAATKGVMFCHHLKRIAPALFERVNAAVDINPMKAGRFMPSVSLPILGFDAFCGQVKGDELVLVMNPNYRDEIVADLSARGLDDLQFVSA